MAEKFCSKDLVAASLFASYHAAVVDPANELIHLYEIRDALSKKFSGERQARKALNLSASDWSRLGQIANSEPINQGRHRGKSAGILREAKKEELKEARDITQKFIEAYLIYIDSSA